MYSIRFITASALAFTLLFSSNAFSEPSKQKVKGFAFFAVATAAQETTPNASLATGEVYASFDEGLTEVQVLLEVEDLSSPAVGAHFHCARPGANGPVVFGLLNPGPLSEIIDEASVTLTNLSYSGADCTGSIGRPVNNIAALYFAMKDGLIYLNVHTTDNPGGEIRAQMQ